LQIGGIRRPARRVAYLLSVIALLGVDRASAPSSLPLGYPPLPAPTANPPTLAKHELGRRLFFERRLSADGTVSCADCHKPENGFSDAVPVSRGVFGRHGVRKTPSLLNVGYQPVLMWDGRAPDLERQIRLPLAGYNEMAMTEASAVAALASDSRYQALFTAAFGNPEITVDRIGQAIATFERTTLIGSPAFDRFIFQGDARTVPAAAQRGWRVFQAKGCITCHHFEAGNPFFTDFQFHNTGVGFDAPKPDLGRYYTTMRLEDRGRFKTPSLIGVAERAPYMHDGRFQTLRQVIDYYDRGATPNPFLDGQLKPLGLTEATKSDLIAFLKALSPEGNPPFEPADRERQVLSATEGENSN
jgi:cytochrome c peroxidase